MTRAQANLTALVVAVVLLTTAMVVGFTVADGAFQSAERDASERGTAIGVSAAITDPSSSLTARQNVFNETAIGDLDAATLEEEIPSLNDQNVTIRLDDESIVETDEDVSGPSIQRIVLVETRQSTTRTPAFGDSEERSVTLPRRTDRAELLLDPDGETTIETVRVNERVVLHDESGLTGEHPVDVSPYETATLTFEGKGDLSEGDVHVQYVPAQTRPAVLEVTVDA